MGEILTRPYCQDDIELLAEIIKEAWEYYVHDVNTARIRELLGYFTGDDTRKFWLSFEDEKLIGVAEVVILESYRYPGEEGRLELLYIRDTASNYYDIHSALMDTVFEFLREEKIDYLRVDTTLENADILLV